MKRIVVFYLIFCVLSFAKIYDFVPADFDLILLFKDIGENYSEFKKIPLGSFVLESEGIGMEYIAVEVLNDVENTSGISKDIVLKTLSDEMMIAAKGMTLDFNSLTSLDLNYYIDTLKNLGANTILVLKSSSPNELLEFISDLLGLEFSTDEEGYYVLKDDNVAIFAKYYGGYVIMSGGKASIENSIASYTSGTGFVEKHGDARSVLDEDAFAVGYFKGDSFRIEMGIDVEKNAPEIETEKFELVGKVRDGRISVVVKQYVTGDLEKPKEYLTTSRDMGRVPSLGNYFFGASARGSKAVLDSIMSWFSGKSEELDRMANIVGTVLEHSKGKVYIVGDVVAASEVTFAVIFNLENGMNDIERILEENGAHVEGSEWVMSIGNAAMHMFEHSGRFVMSNLSLKEYETVYERRKLADDPTYSYMIAEFPREDISRGFVNIGDILEKLVGMKVNSKMIFFQTYENGVFIYDLEVM